MILAHVLHVGKDCWYIHVADQTKSVSSAVLAVDAAKAMGATHIRWRDLLNRNGIPYRNPHPVNQPL